MKTDHRTFAKVHDSIREYSDTELVALWNVSQMTLKNIGGNVPHWRTLARAARLEIHCRALCAVVDGQLINRG